jgi:predicted esterase
MDRAKLAADELGWVLIGVDAYRNSKSLEDGYEERMRHIRAAFEAAKGRVMFDPKKIVFSGMSGGAWWSYQCASELTLEAAGIIACGGWMGRMYGKRYSPRMAVAVITGDKDTSALNFVEPDGKFLKSKASAKVREFSFEGGHVMPSKELFAEAARWIHGEKKF